MMQHQYWVTKKTVLKKLGTKEDDCIVSSDAELDAKLELFRSISDSCLQLQRVLDQYQERLCVLAQEENALGKFLRDTGKGDDAAAKHMVSAGKSISYCGQQRLSVRSPLLRLYHEVETFRGRAVSDMRSTISAMEKARIEYRAALSWMKSTSQQLDPDTGRGLDNFRKAQRQVRESKKAFDKLTLDVLQKIDLLAAARCNMFSHVLVNYQSSFKTFSCKVTETLVTAAESMKSNPQYEFSILKELSQNLGDGDSKELVPQDKDQMLFFKDDYKDTDNVETKNSQNKEEIKEATALSEPSMNLVDTSIDEASIQETGINMDLYGLNIDNIDAVSGFMPSQLLQNFNTSLLDSPMASSSKLQATPDPSIPPAAPPASSPANKKKEEKAAWFKLFAELDPLANPDSLMCSSANQSHAA